MKIPTFCIDADDDIGPRPFGTAANMEVTRANANAEIQVAIDTLANGEDGDRVTLVLTRHDMTSAELDALPEE